ncbi:hypothetical protein [Pontibacter ruber]|uniref:Outer membrane protein beta-barrel domain-containing protein n=1 Tax=Pontibacter ruber TaxID=1343895 RepID=A0ABW5CY46_9BACT|nr:hypothetical protein [Pontibacter ruber]
MMKRLLLFVFVTLLSVNTRAQTTKGTITFTGTLAHWQVKHRSEFVEQGSMFGRIRTTTLAPSIGGFVKDNLELGAILYIYQDNHEDWWEGFRLDKPIDHPWDETYSSYDEHKIDYRVYARQYKYLTGKLAAHFTLSAGISNRHLKLTRGRNVNEIVDHKEEETNFYTALSPGLTYFALKNLGFSANLGALSYTRHKFLSANPDFGSQPYKSNVVKLDFSSMNVNFGMTYFLRK